VTERISQVKARDRFTWEDVEINVIRVAKDGTWADIHCHVGESFWTKRQPLPMPEGCIRAEADR
jgi:hypothetical protein